MMARMGSLLEVIALHPADAEAAQEGGADRLELCASMEADGLSPSVSTVSAIRRSTDLPLRVMLRLSDSFTTNGAELNRLTAKAQSYLSAGADGFVLGFLTPDNVVDVESVAALASTFAGTPWTFHRAIDAVLDQPVGLACAAVAARSGLRTDRRVVARGRTRAGRPVQAGQGRSGGRRA